MASATGGNQNTIIGNRAGELMTVGFANTIIGAFGMSTTTGSINSETGIGHNVFGASRTTSGGSNVAIGANAMASTKPNSARNIAIGLNAASGSQQIGSVNIIIGESAGGQISGDNNIIIGKLLGAAGNNRTYIMNLDTSTGVSGSSLRVANDGSGLVGLLSSSRRFKENIVPLESMGSRLDKLVPVMFNYIADGPEGEPQIGMIAEDTAVVFPETIIYTKDERDEDREKAPMVISSIDYEKFITILIKETQELRARVAALEGL
jgi:hypothetical protein